jgi:hypothetical protein
MKTKQYAVLAILVGACDIHQRHGMGRRLDLTDVELLELLDIAEDLAELRAELLFLLGRQVQPRQVRDVFDINLQSGHGRKSGGSRGGWQGE